jgi:hypothetical protein
MQVTIQLRSASEYRTREYGVLFESIGTFETAGRQNSHFPHRVVVWDNTSRPMNDSGTIFCDPIGKNTEDRQTVLISAESIVLSAHRDPNPDPRLDIFLKDGDLVTLVFPDGTTRQFVSRVPKFSEQRLIPVAE